jgi:hypothetical protein
MKHFSLTLMYCYFHSFQISHKLNSVFLNLLDKLYIFIYLILNFLNLDDIKFHFINFANLKAANFLFILNLL